MWCEAGRQVRRLTVGDTIELRLRDIETVAFPVAARPPGSQPERAAEQDTTRSESIPRR
mgnify:CR=1 FL=1